MDVCTVTVDVRTVTVFDNCTESSGPKMGLHSFPELRQYCQNFLFWVKPSVDVNYPSKLEIKDGLLYLEFPDELTLKAIC